MRSRRQVGRRSSDRFDQPIAYFHYESVIEGGGQAQIKVKALEAPRTVAHRPTENTVAVRQFQRRIVALRFGSVTRYAAFQAG